MATTALTDPAPPTLTGPLQVMPRGRPTSPLQRAGKFGQLVGELAARHLGAQLASAALLPLHPDGRTWQELLAIQQAVLQRLQQQQADWLTGCASLAREYTELRQTNTVSKFVAQEYNVVAQFAQLAVNHTTSLVGLLENIQIDYGYWLAQQRDQAAR